MAAQGTHKGCPYAIPDRCPGIATIMGPYVAAQGTARIWLAGRMAVRPQHRLIQRTERRER